MAIHLEHTATVVRNKRKQVMPSLKKHVPGGQLAMPNEAVMTRWAFLMLTAIWLIQENVQGFELIVAQCVRKLVNNPQNSATSKRMWPRVV